MLNRLITVVLGVAVLFALLTFLPDLRAMRLQGNDEGFTPPQPIAFSHRLHAGELSVDCLYCHHEADDGRYAGVPAATTCMNCHRFVSAPFGAVRAEDAAAREEGRDPRPVLSPEIAKIYASLGLNSTGAAPDPDATPVPVEWIRVHTIPDYAYFNHSSHVTAGVNCTTCHGDVASMERMRQVSTLSMGWCVNCHRDLNTNGVAGQVVQAPTDCSGCHF